MAMAQNSRKGLYAGIGAGLFQYKTSWYYYRFDGNPRHDNYPEHSIHKTTITLSLEKRSLLQAKDIHFDVGGELLLGISGKAKGDWLPGEEVISSGGFAAGFNGFFRAVYPITAGQNLSISPFIGLGPQFTLLHNNGKNVGTQFASNAYYNYTDGWNEYVLLFNGSVGANFEFPGFSLTPELRFGIIGTSFTNWEPNEDGVSMEKSPGFLGFSIKIAKKLN
jgi:hypothetical protein